MKTKSYFKILLIFLVFIFVASSCSLSKKTAINCPVLPRSNGKTKVVSNLKKYDKNAFSFSQKKSNRDYRVRNDFSSVSKKFNINNNTTAKLNNQTNNITTSVLEKVIVPDIIEYNLNLTASKDNLISSINNQYARYALQKDNILITINSNLSDKNHWNPKSIKDNFETKFMDHHYSKPTFNSTIESSHSFTKKPKPINNNLKSNGPLSPDDNGEEKIPFLSLLGGLIGVVSLIVPLPWTWIIALFFMVAFYVGND